MTRCGAWVCMSAALAAMPALAQNDASAERDLAELQALLPGIYTNEEQSYFHKELERDPALALPRLTLQIQPDRDGFIARTFNPATGRETEARLLYRVDNGMVLSREERPSQPVCGRKFTREFEQFRGAPLRASDTCGGTVVVGPEGFSFGAPANPFEMLRAQSFSCWVSPQKRDGSYGFYSNVRLHDGGGRAWLQSEGVGDSNHPRVGLKMRHVRWPTGRNRDSLVLYAYRGEEENRAESYVWTSPDADRIALNLRWMQASCTRGDTDEQAELVRSPISQPSSP